MPMRSSSQIFTECMLLSMNKYTLEHISLIPYNSQRFGLNKSK